MLGARLIIGLIFTIILTLFIHFREPYTESLTVGNISKKPIFAKIDFKFADPSATAIIKYEAQRDIGNIYKIEQSDIEHVTNKFENYLVNHPNWRKGNDITFEEMYGHLKSITKLLIDAKFTDVRTVKKTNELKTPQDNFYTSYNIDGGNFKKLPNNFWEEVKKKLTKKNNININEHTIEFIINYLQECKWNIYNDIDEQLLHKRLIEKEIPEKFTHVKAGDLLLKYQEKITDRHIVMVNAMKKEFRNANDLWSLHLIIGSIFFSIITVILGSLYFYIQHREFFISAKNLTLYTIIISLLFIFIKLSEFTILLPALGLIEFIKYPVFLPFATILLYILINEEIALFSTFILTIIIGTTFAFNIKYYMIINMITSIIAIVVSKKIKKRKEIFFVNGKILISTFIVIIGYNFIDYKLFSMNTLIDLSAATINLLIISILLIIFLPILESMFSIITDMTLMEYTDPTNELLRRLSIEAPGTYQHSLSIGHISEGVANSIGANGFFCRVTTLYHDIGKLNTPQYYTENQMLNQSKPFNIHLLLTSAESAYIIKSHIPDGVALAKQYKLPRQFIDIIMQHHGTTLIKYFYLKQLEEVSGNVKNINENTFRYAGPKPQTKEAAIIMLSDSIEAASRSLEDNSEASIRALVEKISYDKVNDGQFNECNLTFKELTIIKNKLVEMLMATHHLRIKYPESLKDNTNS